MKVKSKKYSAISVMVNGKEYSFAGGYCEIPDADAMKLATDNSNYEIITSSINGRVPFNAQTWRDKKLVFDAPIGFSNGYGKAASLILKGLRERIQAYHLGSDWIGNTEGYEPQEVLDAKKETFEINDMINIIFFPAWEFTRATAQRTIGYTMLECTKIPKSWVENCNTYCERIIVPCEHQVKAFRDSGVTVDVVSIPLGIDPEEFPYLERKREDTEFWFGTSGNLTYRKGTDVLVKAFLEAFPLEQYPDVKLLIKTQAVNGVASAWFLSSDILSVEEREANKDRIKLQIDTYSPKEMLEDFYGAIDCFVFPTRGEGFGLPPVEAMATGLPTICTNYSGCEEFMSNKHAYCLDYKEALVPLGAGGYPKDLQAEGQMWAEPDLEHLKILMKEVYENQDKAKKKGKLASEYIKKNFSYKNTVDKLIEYVDKKF